MDAVQLLVVGGAIAVVGGLVGAGIKYAGTQGRESILSRRDFRVMVHLESDSIVVVEIANRGRRPRRFWTVVLADSSGSVKWPQIWRSDSHSAYDAVVPARAVHRLKCDVASLVEPIDKVPASVVIDWPPGDKPERLVTSIPTDVATRLRALLEAARAEKARQDAIEARADAIDDELDAARDAVANGRANGLIQ